MASSESNRRASLAYYYRNKERLNKERRKGGYRSFNVKGYSANYRQTLKIDVLTYYGGGKLACVACGENQLPCLSIDHIDGNGAAQRKEMGKGSGNAFYAWLRKDNYPAGYQTLCMNCQYIKRDLAKEYGNRWSNRDLTNSQEYGSISYKEETWQTKLMKAKSQLWRKSNLMRLESFQRLSL